MLGILVFPCYVLTHPMGNFSISHYSGIGIGRGFVEVRYWIDMAEIPTLQKMQQNGFGAYRDDSRLPVYLSAQAAAFAQGLHVIDDDPRSVVGNHFCCLAWAQSRE
jgi:hypothetical protein